MNPRFTTLVAIILLMAAFRIIPHPANVTPVAAMALFAGVHFGNRWLALLIPLSALLLSDFILGIHSTMPFVYAAFVVTVMIGFIVRSHVSAANLLIASLTSSVLFFLVTNLGVWLLQDIYPQTLDGMFLAYTAAIPFFRNTLMGDLGFVAIVFGSYGLAQHKISWLRRSHSVRN